MSTNVVIWLTLIYVSEVSLMTTNGSTVTLYDPCGLDSLVFYKISQYNAWQAKLNLKAYIGQSKVLVKILFKDFVTIAVNDLSHKGPWNQFQIQLPAPVPSEYKFFVRAYVSQMIPKVKEYSINDHVICSEEIKDKFDKAIDIQIQENRSKDEHVCGLRNFDSAEVISMIGDAKVGDWPWHVLVFYNSVYRCGGNLISGTTVLTAGHCIYKNGYIVDPRNVMISAGITNFTNIEHLKLLLTLGIIKQVQAESIFLHPSFVFEKSSSDLAIVKIEPLEFTISIQPVCIFGPTYEDKVSLIGRNGMVVGFGLNDKDHLSQIQKATLTTVQPDSTCMKFSPTVYGSLLNEFTFCSGLYIGIKELQGINPREGDSGAGFVIPVTQEDNTLKWFLRGILSKCVKLHADDAHCDPNMPVVYTDKQTEKYFCVLCLRWFRKWYVACADAG